MSFLNSPGFKTTMALKQRDERINELSEKIKELEKANKNYKTTKVTVGTQFLLMHYLKLFSNIDTKSNSKKALLLKYLFNADGDENIRKSLSEIGNIKKGESKEPFTHSNLSRVCEIFSQVGLDKEYDEATKDLNKRTP